MSGGERKIGHGPARTRGPALVLAALCALALAVLLSPAPGALAQVTLAQTAEPSEPAAAESPAVPPAPPAETAAPPPAAASAPAAPAGIGPTNAQSPTAEEIEALLETLEDLEKRQALIKQLRALRALTSDKASGDGRVSPLAEGLEALSVVLGEIGGKFSLITQELSNIDKLAQWLLAQWTDPQSREKWRSALVIVLSAIGSGLLTEWLIRRGLKPIERRLFDRQVANVLARLGWSMAQLLVALMPIAGLVVVGYFALALLEPTPTARLAGLALINAIVMARALIRFEQALLQPRWAGIRLAPLGDENAAYLDVWFSRFSNVVIYSYFSVEALRLFGLPEGGYLFLSNLAGLAAALLPVIFILQNRRNVADWLRGVGPTVSLAQRWRRRIADVWHLPAVGYVVVIYLIWTLNISGGFGFIVRGSVFSIAIVILAKFLARGATYGMGIAFELSRELRARHPALEARANRYLNLLVMAVRLAIYAGAGFLVLAAWGIDSLSWIGRLVASELGASLASILITALGAMLIWDLLCTMMEGQVARRSAGGPIEARKAARLRTFLPILQKFLLGLLLVVVGFVALSELGVDIAPLLAGAGVIGIAVGLGAQTAAKDIITSVFHILDDTFTVGDMVVIAGHTGVIEDITLRVIRLRDADGRLHVIPFSEAGIVTNLTYALIEVGVDYATDIDRAMTVMKEVAAELRRDTNYSASILADLEMLGVNAFNDSSISILARIKTMPVKQVALVREFRRRLKLAFDAAGISMPFPQRTIHMAQPEPKR